MIAGVSWAWWLGFHLAVAVFVAADAWLPEGGGGRRAEVVRASLATVVSIGAAAGLAGWIAVAQGRTQALEFTAGYAIEISLSIDNLFVFLVIFRGFGLGRQRERRALLYGVMGAIVLRGLFIAAGLALLQTFEWVSWLFGAILLYAAWRLVRGGSAEAALPAWVGKLTTRRRSLLPVILAVEVTDLLFAVDSVPAVLAITRSPFLAYTSNIAAILGLRSLYTLLSSALDRLRYLHYGLGVLLAFVAFKILAAHWIDVPVTLSLGIFAGILGVCVVVSWVAGPAPAARAKSQ